MNMPDANRLFARAEHAFAAGRIDAARADLVEAQRAAEPSAPVLHLLALIEKKRGDLSAARDAFEQALSLTPADPEINSNYANLLDLLADPDGALTRYEQALATDPRFVDAFYNRALLLDRLGRLAEALDDLDCALAITRSAKAHSARGGVLRSLGRPDEAAAAYDAALALEPGRAAALHGRARLALERGEASATERFVAALQRRPGDPGLVLDLVEALDAEGDATGIDLLDDAVRARPDWVQGHVQLARMRAEAGEGTRFARSFEEALAAQPANRLLLLAYLQSLAGAELYREGVDALERARPHLPQDRDLILIEARLRSDAGDFEGAEASFRLLDNRADAEAARGRHALRTGNYREADARFSRVVAEEPDNIAGWANLALAWRLSHDSRFAWLCGQRGLWSSRQLEMPSDTLARLAHLLRGLHRFRAHPLGQSLRGGTQTRGRLFWRQEPEISALREALREAVMLHVEDLPPADPTHPLLRHREARLDFAGSWSVRLTGQGFHVSHIHPRGILSSAFYVSLPEGAADPRAQEGWLELGRPPAELRLDLPPLATIQPVPGRLALFPSYLFHGTRPLAAGERLTVAFDLAVQRT